MRMRSAATRLTSASRAFSKRTVSEGSATRNTVWRPRFARKWMGNAAMFAAHTWLCRTRAATTRFYALITGQRSHYDP